MQVNTFESTDNTTKVVRGSHALCLTIVILITHIGYLDSINANEYM